MVTWNLELPVPLHQWSGRKAFLENLQRCGGSLVLALHECPWVTVETPDTLDLDAVVSMPGIRSIETDGGCYNCMQEDVVAAAPRSWALDEMRVPQAHLVTRGAGVKLAVVDTGLSAHPDLAKSTILAQTSFVSGEGPDDLNGHGTATTGIAASQDLGVAPEVSIINLKAIGKRGHGLWSWVAAAVDRAIELRADVVLMALGGDGSSRMVEDTLRGLTAAGGIPVVAAGNSGGNSLEYPGSSAYVIAVTSSDHLRKKPTWASTAPPPATPDAVTPGVGVLTLQRGDGYRKINGTSASAALAAGAVALLLATQGAWHERLAGETLMDWRVNTMMPARITRVREAIHKGSPDGILDAADLVHVSVP